VVNKLAAIGGSTLEQTLRFLGKGLVLQALLSQLDSNTTLARSKSSCRRPLGYIVLMAADAILLYLSYLRRNFGAIWLNFKM